MQSHPPCWQVDRDHADRPCCRFAHLHFVSLGLLPAVDETRERLNHQWYDEYSDYGYPRRIIDSTTKASIIAILVV